MNNKILAIVLWMSLWPSLAVAETSQLLPLYYLAGQVHPQYEITLHINSREIKMYRSNSGKMKLFLKQVDANQVHSGANQLKVTWRKRPGVTGNKAFGPAFKVKLKYQTDPMDKKSARVLTKIRGSKPPFTGLPDSGEMIKEFVAPR
jgi:hypothetical protein